MACGLRITGRGGRQGHGIHPMSAPGVTPAQAPEREPAAPCHTMQLQGFDGVFRAAGPVATAGWKDTAESALVALHHGHESTSSRLSIPVFPRRLATGFTPSCIPSVCIPVLTTRLLPVRRLKRPLTA